MEITRLHPGGVGRLGARAMVSVLPYLPFGRTRNATNQVITPASTLTKLRSLLLIDDAVGSAATMRAIATKIKAINPGINIIAFAPVGPFKGFDVIRDI